MSFFKFLSSTTAVAFLAMVLWSTMLIVSAKQEPFRVSTDGSPHVTSAPVYFEENRGQFDSKVRYFARGTDGYSVFLTASDAVYVISKPETEREDPFSDSDRKTTAAAVFMRLVNGNESASPIGETELVHKTNYFKGSVETAWRTELPNYAHVRRAGVYEGIDVVWSGNSDGLVGPELQIKPNASVDKLSWEIEGAESVRITLEGDLILATPLGEIRQQKPTIRQDGLALGQVNSRFVIQPARDGSVIRIGLELGEYDPSAAAAISSPMSIDSLAYSTFLGGNDTDNGNAIVTDASGNAYVTGIARSVGFPTTAGTYDTTHNNEFDVFVSKLNSSGTGLIYSTFIGGSSSDGAYGIALDSSGNVIVTGTTGSTGYPTTAGAYDTTYNGNGDVVVTKLSASGSALVYSTFIGGAGSGETAYDIAIDSLGDVYLVGSVNASGYPTTPGAFDTTYNGGDFDIFVSRLSASGTQLVYSTYLGGASFDQGRSIAIDAANNSYVTGYTQSTEYPTTPGAFDTTHGIGDFDSYVTKLSPDGTQLIYSTFLGGSFSDQGYGIAVGSSGNAYVGGATDSGNYPTTMGAYDTSYNGQTDGFVSKLNPSGTALVFSTYVGAGSLDHPRDLALDTAGSAYITGVTSSTSYPTTPSAFDTTHNGGFDVFVTKLDASGAGLSYSTFIGSNGTEDGSAIAADAMGDAYVTGTANSATYPTTPGAIDTTYNGESDVFVSKLFIPGTGTAPFDFDGDGKTDLGIFRPSVAEWWINRSSNGTTFAAQFGATTDRLVPGDFTGDGKADIAIWRPSSGEWFILRSEDSSFFSFPFGTTGDTPMPADYDNDGKVDAAVFRESTATWYVRRSSDGGTTIEGFGASGDVPVVADYDGDGKSDIAIYRPSLGQWWIKRSTLGVIAFTFGTSADKPVQGDYTGDGKSDVAFWRPSTGEWYILRSEDFSYYSQPFGTSTDIPSPGDYDGDGEFDPTVFRPSSATWFSQRSTAGTLIQQFGSSGDVPVPNAFVP